MVCIYIYIEWIIKSDLKYLQCNINGNHGNIALNAPSSIINPLYDKPRTSAKSITNNAISN